MKRKTTPFPNGGGRWGMIACTLLAHSLTAELPAQETTQDWARSLADRLAREVSQWDIDIEPLMTIALEEIDLNEMKKARAILMTALESGSMDDLAALRPYAEQVLQRAEMSIHLRPLAAWLRQRLDYFETASDVVRQREAPPPGTPAPTEPSVTESDYALWYNRISQRRPPAKSATLVPALKPVFRAEGVPEALVWVAEVESSFDSTALSPAGARGLYQFMPATAERFGLELKPNDERLDPHKSAVAAAQYLRILHRRFGDWQLALAAYNAGEGRVGRLLQSRNATSFEEIATHLPTETRMYVPKVRAVLQVREGIDLLSI